MPAPDQTNKQKWYLSRNGKQVGPFNSASLKNLANTGMVLPTDLVWQEGSKEPAIASTIKGLLPTAATTSSTNNDVVEKGRTVSSSSTPTPQLSSSSSPPKGIFASIASRIRKLIRIVRIAIKISFVVGLILLVVGLVVGIRNVMHSRSTLVGSSSDKQKQISEAKKQVERIENTLAKLETVLNSAKADRNGLAMQLKSMGIKTTSDLRGNTRAKRTAEDIGRLANEIESQEKKVASVASQYQQAKAIVRRMEIEQVGLSEEEMKSLSLQLLETDTSDDGWSKAITPLDTDEAVNNVLSLSDEELSTSYASISAERNTSESSPEKSATGKGIFAEEFSVGNKDPKAISELQKTFQGFPQSCVSVSVVGKPEILEKTSDQAKIKIVVKVEANQEAFKRFRTQLIPIMKKLSNSSGEFTAKFKNANPSSATAYYVSDPHTLEKGIPQAFDRNGSAFKLKNRALAIAVEDSRTKSGESIDYRYFMLDHSLQSELASAASQTIRCKLQLTSLSGEIIVTERFTVPSLISSYGELHGYFRELGLVTEERESYGNDIQPDRAQVYVLGSVFFMSRTDGFHHTATPFKSFELSLNLDELKSVKDIKVEILP